MKPRRCTEELFWSTSTTSCQQRTGEPLLENVIKRLPAGGRRGEAGGSACYPRGPSLPHADHRFLAWLTAKHVLLPPVCFERWFDGSWRKCRHSRAVSSALSSRRSQIGCHSSVLGNFKEKCRFIDINDVDKEPFSSLLAGMNQLIFHTHQPRTASPLISHYRPARPLNYSSHGLTAGESGGRRCGNMEMECDGKNRRERGDRNGGNN